MRQFVPMKTHKRLFAGIYRRMKPLEDISKEEIIRRLLLSI